jgi:Rps23 Pro-64 3,4-dihydroxylase Tpa1-like proline 4-hydroxylase
MFGFFDYKRLEEIARENTAVYTTAAPFPYVVIDNVADKYLLNDALNAFPSPEKLEWWKYGNVFEKKLAFDKVHELDEDLQKLLCELNSSKFVRFLEELTGIKHLIADPHYTGGGLHQIENGGLLKLHADFNFNANLKLHRRLNVLLYLNHDWKEEYGGQLELWDKDVTKCYHSILPLFNRMVVFSTTDGSIHGHPTPLNVPPGVTRKSVALYYYTAERPTEEISAPHSTMYKFKPTDDVTPELKDLQEKRSKGRI